MAGYTNNYNNSNGEFIDVTDFEPEFANLEIAFDQTTGHKHDGSDDGAYIRILSSPDNKAEFSIQSGEFVLSTPDIPFGGVKTPQMIFKTGSIMPSLTNTIDLGENATKFKDAYLTSIVLDAGVVVNSILDEDAMTSDSNTALATQQSIKAYAATQLTAANSYTDTQIGLGLGSYTTSQINSPDEFNVVEIDDGANSIIISTDVASVKTTQLTIDASAILPATGLTIDLGAGGNKFNELHAGAASINSLSISGSGVIVGIFDEDNMGSDSDSALATQQSIKAFGTTNLNTATGYTDSKFTIVDSGLAKVARTVGVPTTAAGLIGDSAGQIAVDSGFIYTCHTHWSDNPTINATAAVNAQEYEIIATGDTDFTLIGAANSLPGTIFTASGPGAGTGTIKITDPLPDIWARTAITTW